MLDLLHQNSTQTALAIDIQRRRRLLLVVGYVICLVLTFYGFRHLQADNPLLPLLLLSTATLSLVNLLVFHFTQNLERACIIKSLLVCCFVIGLAFQGGVDNTGLYWIFPFPAILFGLLGDRRGGIVNLLVLLVLCVLIFTPSLTQAHYPPDQAIRFLLSLLFVIGTAYINELYRHRSYTAIHELQRTREVEANTDPLTQLVNRRFLASFTQKLKQQPDAYFPMTVMMCDIDYFKQLNDTYGHDVGDQVLQQVAKILRQKLRQQDIACRTGGEEFLLFLPKTEEYGALVAAEKIRNTIEHTRFIEEDPAFQVTASFGLATCSHYEQLEASIKEADAQLYQAKHLGRNRVCQL